MIVVLYRPSLDARSGAGQLLEMQWRGLTAAGIDTIIAGQRGGLRFWFRTGVRARRRTVAQVERLLAQGAFVADHGLSIPGANLVFVHNLASEVRRHLPSADLAGEVEREREFFGSLNPAAFIVANSRLVAQSLRHHFGIADERVTVLYPGYRSQRFTLRRAAESRTAARAALRIDARTLLVGFVTSGDFAKRGLDVFLDCAARIAELRPDVRFLVVGSKELPQWARAHPLVLSGVVHHRPKGPRPQPWFAAFDLFLYAARFEEFGMVIAEAQAMGVPVLTSRLVGASECLPEVYARWLLDRPDPKRLAALAVTMLADADLRRELAAAAAASVTAFAERAYIEGTLRLIEAQKRRLK